MLRILIVDDDPDQRHLLLTALGDQHTVVETGDPLRVSDMQPESYDLIITDLMMPGLSGVELKRRLDQQGVTVPMLLVSSDPDVGREAVKAGFSDFLSKPYSLDQLEAIIAVMASRQATRVTLPRVAAEAIVDAVNAPSVDNDGEPEG